MATYISIAEDITDETIRQIEAADGDVVVVHAICGTIPGRRKLARILKRRGCRTEAVHRLGWATASPATEARLKPCSLSPSPSPSQPRDYEPGIMIDALEDPSPPKHRKARRARVGTSSSSRRGPKPTTPSDS